MPLDACEKQVAKHTGRLKRTLMKHQDHPIVDVEKMEETPAEAAGKLGLVGVHTPEAMAKVGAWRWPLVYKHRSEIVALLTSGPAIDFGGAAAPVGYGAKIVDRLSEHRSLCDVAGPVATIFASHILEHCVDLHAVLCTIKAKLYAGGTLIVNCPSWGNVHLQSSTFPYHSQTFCLSTTAGAAADWLPLDNVLLRYGFDIKVIEEEPGNLFLIAMTEASRCGMLQ